jgi:hypothetical protein
MAVRSVHISIGTLRVPAGSPLEREDLQRRVGLELAALLARAPLREARGSSRVPLRLEVGSVRAASTASCATVAHALARHIHAALRREDGRA